MSVTTRVVYVVMGITMERDILGRRANRWRSSKFWLGVMTEAIADVLVLW
jgi:transposase-like protein